MPKTAHWFDLVCSADVSGVFDPHRAKCKCDDSSDHNECDDNTTPAGLVTSVANVRWICRPSGELPANSIRVHGGNNEGDSVRYEVLV
jgi:hypothetical protein